MAEPSKTRKKRGGGPLSGLINLVTGAAGAWILYSNLVIDHHVELPNAITARRETLFGTGAGMLSYYSDREGTGRPLVLLHSINAAGCSYETRPIFEHYRGSRPVYALDLPGFGFSERSDREYAPALYKDAILSFLREVVGQPADVIALSLSCEFAAMAALEAPDAFHSLTMISPSGFNARDTGRSSQKASSRGQSDLVYRILSFPAWGRPLFDLISTRRSIDFFLGQSFEGLPDAGLADYGYLTAHRPGAHYAPLYFVSGKLFTRDIRETVYEQLTLPVLVVHDRDNFVRFDELPALVEGCENWHTARIQPTLGLPHFEKPVETFAALDDFWGKL
jgi:pimeloyl-ACP methyl ester carboxylesterase